MNIHTSPTTNSNSISSPNTGTGTGTTSPAHLRESHGPTPIRGHRLRWCLTVVMFPLFMALLHAVQLIWLIPGLETWVSDAPETVAVSILIAQYALVLLLTILLAAALARAFGRTLKDAGWVWTKNSPSALLIGMGTVIALTLPVTLAMSAAGLGRDPMRWHGEASTFAIIAAGLAMAFLLQGIPEELLFRGVLLDVFRDHPQRAVWISAVAFAIPHLISSGGQQNTLEHVLYLAIPFGFGLLAGALVLLTGSLWSAIGVHGGYHVGNLIAGFAGASLSPAMWVAQGVVLTTAAILLMGSKRFVQTRG